MCRQVKPKRELLRLVRTPQGTVEIDPTGKKSGRGAYLCRTKSCWEAGLKRKKLEYALKATSEQISSLLEYSKTFTPEIGDRMSHSDQGDSG